MAEKPTELDDYFMDLALKQAHCSIGLSDPNPRVGCVIVSESGELLASGYTQAAGGAHAEAMALRQARERNVDLRGATVYVTLEPCAHQGRTPPCAHALAESGISKIYIGVEDPFPSVSGRGTARLRHAGIAVTIYPSGRIQTKCSELNKGFFSRVVRGRPWIRLKIAMSVDGKTALLDGTSKWITSKSARIHSSIFRSRASAILSGIGTILADDPALNVRYHSVRNQPLCAIVDSELRTPPTAAIFKTKRRVLIYTRQNNIDRGKELINMGCEVRPVVNDDEGLDLAQIVADLGNEGVNELHIEAGARLAGSFLHLDLVDELTCYIAPMVIGRGQTPFEFLMSAVDIIESTKWRFSSVETCGPDLYVGAVRVRRHWSFYEKKVR